MAKGKKPLLFQVGTMDQDGHETIKTLATTQVHRLISDMNGSSNIITIVLKKIGKQAKIKLSES